MKKIDIEKEIHKLKWYIELCKSHRNFSNKELIDGQIEFIKEKIKELEKEKK